MTAQPDITISGLCYDYTDKQGKLRVLDSVDLEIMRGELVTIVGASGCGKTTLLKLAAGMLEPTSGKVTPNLKRIAGGIAYVPQQPSLLPWRTLLQNATLGLELSRQITSASLDNVRDAIERFHLVGFEDHLPNQLSGGMQQRVALIRALLRGPNLLFCDEPFSSIDFVTRLELTTEFRNLCKNLKVTTVFVTHNIEEAMFLGDKLVVMTGRPGAGRPGTIAAIHTPYFSVGRESSVKCRSAPEFPELFNTIWGQLNDAH